jgi:tripartite-type tricarboxylate transporter receptor subunit TctC
MTALRAAVAALPMLAGLVAATPASAAFPERPIKMIIIVAPGGGMDFTARLVADHMTKKLNQQVVVQSQPGGGGNIAFGMVANAPPDGYTILMTSPAIITNHFLFKNAQHHPVNDFVPLSLVTRIQFLMVARKDLPVKSMSEMIAYAKARPGQVTTANGAIGGITYLSEVLLNQMADLKMKIVNYRGNSLAINDLLAGNIDTMFADPPGFTGHIAAGNLRALGITSPTRSKQFPDIPPIADTVPGYDMQSWYGVFAPKGTPPEIAQTLSKALAEAARDQSVIEAFVKQSSEPVGSTSEELAAVVKADMAKYSKLIGDLGLKLD